MEKKKFQAWVDESKLLMLDVALAGKTRVDWLNKMIDNKINGALDEMEDYSIVTGENLQTATVGLPIDEEIFKMLDVAVKKLGFESAESWLLQTVKETVIKSKNKPELEFDKEKDHANGITKARKQQGFTQTEVAKLVGIDRSYYNLIENGHRLPSMDLINQICELIGLSLEEFYKAHNELKKR